MSSTPSFIFTPIFNPHIYNIWNMGDIQEFPFKRVVIITPSGLVSKSTGVREIGHEILGIA
jgi:hypothetical protein